MSEYLIWNHLTLVDPTQDKINSAYNNGFLLTRIGKYHMIQTRSVRIDLSDFEFTSENRRILDRNNFLELYPTRLPISEDDYDWHIHKMGSDFYSEKFGVGTFSANAIRRLITDEEDSSFTKLFCYKVGDEFVGFCICFENEQILHYAYPFYDYHRFPNIGMGLMTLAVQKALKANKRYIFLGSASRPADKYKLQFKNLEWFDGASWKNDLEELKLLLRQNLDDE